jgi:transcriptional regulator with XRE-family HTH domain
LRLERRWEREQLAQIANVSMEDVRMLESAGSASFETIQAVAGAFGLEIHELLREPAAGTEPSQFIASGLSSSALFKPWQNRLPSFLLPYLPIVKSALAASAFALLAAFAIRLSPFIIERDPHAELVESFEISQPAYTVGVASLEAELGTEVLSDSEDPAANPRYAYKRTAPVPGGARTSLPPGTGNFPTESVAPSESAGRPDVFVSPEDRIDYWATAESAITLNSADFTSFASTRDPDREIPIEVIAPLNFGDLDQTDGDNVFELMARGTSTGFKSVGRSLVISGKSTAAFFSKVGSSIKKAF